MNPDFKKGKGLLPVIVQDLNSLQVLMLGYMNAEALKKTQETRKVTFFSRSKQRLWTKGESSGNSLIVNAIREDCDRDSLLILAESSGPTCHTGSVSCFDTGAETAFDVASADQDQNTAIEAVFSHQGEDAAAETSPIPPRQAEDTERFIYQLEKIIHERIRAGSSTSYTSRLYQKGINKVAQKVGEEAVELVIEAKDNHADLFKNEAADLLYHYLILLKAKGFSLADIEAVLEERSR